MRKRTGSLTTKGYKLLFRPEYSGSRKSGYILEHRFIMEKYLNRPLCAKETIHHINHNKIDNRIENLYLCDSESEHKRNHFNFSKVDGIWFKICPDCKNYLEVNIVNFRCLNKEKKLFRPMCRDCDKLRQKKYTNNKIYNISKSLNKNK